MYNFLFLLALLVSQSSSAQVEFLTTQTVIGSSFGLPISVNLQGDISFIDKNDEFAVGPSLQVGISTNNVSYSMPMRTQEFNLSPVNTESLWLDIRRIRYEAGLGLAALLKEHIDLGISPYRGGILMMNRVKPAKDFVTSQDIRMPKSFEEIAEWNVGDRGLFQTFGAVEVFVGTGISAVNLIKAAVSFQNQFILEVKKVSYASVVVKVAEEHLNRKEGFIGPIVARGSLSYFRGNRFTSEFTLDLENAEHASLYEELIKGKITTLQTNLPHDSQKVSWVGQERSLYRGVPYIRGITQSIGEYEVLDNDKEANFFIASRKNSGIFATVGLHQQVAYATEAGILIFWSSEMKKVKASTMEKYVLRHGRALGIKGFNHELSRQNLGAVISQMGLIFTRADILNMKKLNLAEIESTFKIRCETTRQDCREPRKLRATMNKVSKVMSMTWEEMKADLGEVLVKEPALIHSILKLLNVQKKAYLKFMNSEYQSIEGNIPLEF